MLTAMEFIGALLIGLASGMVGAIATGGGLISVPGLIFMGVSPVSAIATTRLSALSGSLVSLYEYNKGHKVLWKYLVPFSAVAFIAGLIGPRLLLSIRPDLVEPLIGILLLTTLPLLLMSKDFGIIHQHQRRRRKLAGLVMLFFVMIYGTMFGAGGGIFVIYTLTYFFGMTITEANATGTMMWLIGTATALVAYLSQQVVDLSVGIPLLIGAMAGGYFGARMALDKGTAWVKGVLIVVVVVAGVKLIFF